MKTLTIALVLSLALSDAARAGEPDTAIPDLPEILARDFQLVDLSGEVVSLSDLVESGRPCIIEFWATWCAPCRKTLPHLVELEEEHGASLVIVGLTVEDPHEDLDEVRAYADEQGVNFPIAFAPAELFQFMNRRPDIAVPKLFVFDDSGHLVTYIPRYSPFTPRRIRKAVDNVTSGD